MSHLEGIWNNTDLGINAKRLHELVSTKKDSIFVELGVYGGNSTKIFSFESVEHNNFIYSVDVTFAYFSSTNVPESQHIKILSDSVTAGFKWDPNKKIDILFIDSVHTKEQVLCELFYWFDHLKDGSWVIFHDTMWPENKRDIIKNIAYDRPDDAVKQFFNLTNILEYEDDYIKVVTYPESWGMTFIQIKKHKLYKSNISVEDWFNIFDRRQIMVKDYVTQDCVNNDFDMEPGLSIKPG